jgi:hypothetical protein
MAPKQAESGFSLNTKLVGRFIGRYVGKRERISQPFSTVAAKALSELRTSSGTPGKALFRPSSDALPDFSRRAAPNPHICFDPKDFRLRLEQSPEILIYVAPSLSRSLFWMPGEIPAAGNEHLENHRLMKS